MGGERGGPKGAGNRDTFTSRLRDRGVARLVPGERAGTLGSADPRGLDDPVVELRIRLAGGRVGTWQRLVNSNSRGQRPLSGSGRSTIRLLCSQFFEEAP